MKLTKALLAGMFAMSAVSSALAYSGQYDVVLRVTGSTAFRKSTATAISNIIVSGKRIAVVGGTDHLSANAAVYTGTLASGKTILVQTNWSGSEAGYNAVAAKSQPNLTWASDEDIDDAIANHGGQLNGYTFNTTTTTVAGAHVDTAVANVAMADNAQSESAMNGAAYNTLTRTRVGVIPFVWIRSTNQDSTIQASANMLTNMTLQQAQIILTGGMQLSTWSNYVGQTVGVTTYPDDRNVFVLAVGRDNLSGTRLNTLLETFAASKTATSTTLHQNNLTVTANVVTDFAEWPSSQGYTGGGALVQAIGKPVSSSLPVVFVGYAGISDVNATNYPGVTFDSTTGAFTGPVLSYNGVPFSYDNVKNGSYTFWGYEYIAYANTLAGDNLTAVGTLTAQIQTDAAVSGIKLADMLVSRGGAGQAPTNNVN